MTGWIIGYPVNPIYVILAGIMSSGSIRDRKSTRLNSSHDQISYAVFCLKKKNRRNQSSSENTRTPRKSQHRYNSRSLCYTTPEFVRHYLSSRFRSTHYVVSSRFKCTSRE